jgi:predicted GIY-YIG superfamily endonuclease
MIVDYSKGKIYKIVHQASGLVYYGSTCSTLKKRFTDHKSKLKCSSKKLFQYDDTIPEIFLVEEYPCESKEELLRRERFYMENNECVNIFLPIRPKTEYYKDNREHLMACNAKNKIINKDKYNVTRRIWYHKNRDKINANRRKPKLLSVPINIDNENNHII